MADADDRRVVIFFDEFQEIASGRYGVADVVTRQVRAILQRSPRVSTLFAGSVAHVMRDLFALSERAFSQFGGAFELAPITDEEWSAGLRARLELDGCRIDDDALAVLLAATEGHPRATMLVAQHAHAVEELSRSVDRATVQVATDRVMRAERLRHDQVLAQVRAQGRYAQALAERVAHGARLYERLDASSASRTMTRLHAQGLVERGDRRGQWTIVDPLLRRYLQELGTGAPLVIERSGGASLSAHAGGKATTKRRTE